MKLSLCLLLPLPVPLSCASFASSTFLGSSPSQLRSEMEKRRRRWRPEEGQASRSHLFRGEPVGEHKKIKLAPLQVHSDSWRRAGVTLRSQIRTFLLYYR